MKMLDQLKVGKTRHQWMQVPCWGLNQNWRESELGWFGGAWPKVNQARENPLWVGPPNLSAIWKFICKCVETVWPIRGPKTVEIQWSVTKSQSGWGNPITSIDDWWGGSPNMSSIWSTICLQMCGNCLTLVKIRGQEMEEIQWSMTKS